MGTWRTCVLGGLAVLCCAVACGGESAAPATTPLPMQPSGLAVGGDVQPQGTDVAQTRVTDAQLQEIAAACRDAVEITDADSDPCARSVREQFRNPRPCRPGFACMTARLWTNPSGVRELAGSVQVTDDSCVRGRENACLRFGVRTERHLFTVAETSAPGSSPEQTAGSPEDSAERSSPEVPGSEPGSEPASEPEPTPVSPDGGTAPGGDGPGPPTSP